MTGEEEDTDVGFPGPGHHIAERELPMKVAMGALAVCAVVGGLVQIPGVDDAITKFLAPDVRRLQVCPTSRRRRGPAWIGLVIGAAIGDRRHRDRVPDLGRRARHLDPAARAVLGRYTFLSHKWYFDELIDFADRPAGVMWSGASSRRCSSAM